MEEYNRGIHLEKIGYGWCMLFRSSMWTPRPHMFRAQISTYFFLKSMVYMGMSQYNQPQVVDGAITVCKYVNVMT